MKLLSVFAGKQYKSKQIVLIASYSKSVEKKVKGKKETQSVIENTHWPKEIKSSFDKITTSDLHKGAKGDSFKFHTSSGLTVVSIGLGDRTKVTREILRKEIAKCIKTLKSFENISVDVDSFLLSDCYELTTYVIAESIGMTLYSFDKYLTSKSEPKLKEIYLEVKNKKETEKVEAGLKRAETISSSINLARDFINEAPNVLHPETFADLVEKDAKVLKGVKIKVLNKKELQKENMNLFLAVNAGSRWEARLVHLTYEPTKSTKDTPHIALVGKGLTFDSGGYSLKPGASMMNMKFDMAGAASVYAAFRALVKMKVPVKISCFMGITDNMVSSAATTPDSIIKARNGKTVDILNTDAEGRLVLADVVDYACDFKPHVLVDVATLTGAVLVALGSEICAVLGNDQKVIDGLLESSKRADEYMWQLPIIQEHRDDMKAEISDLRNIGKTSYGGTIKGATFIEYFVQPGVKWAHLDIAGIGDSQSHLPYCPSKGASGIIIRSLIDYVENFKV